MGYILSNRGLRTWNRSLDAARASHLKKNATRVRSDAVELVVKALVEHKAADVVVLDLRNLCDVTDYFIVASGSSDTHVRALADGVSNALHSSGRKTHHIEGLRSGRWVLLDYVDFVVHIFHPTLRQFYRLERLWADAPTVAV